MKFLALFIVLAMAVCSNAGIIHSDGWNSGWNGGWNGGLGFNGGGGLNGGGGWNSGWHGGLGGGWGAELEPIIAVHSVPHIVAAPIHSAGWHSGWNSW